MRITLGSLFDGSGGFPLAGVLNGITPVWASEVEPYPIAVTRSRFPGMKHLGSVTEIKGDGVEPVDIITFGSPCQDLSIAGKREGIEDGARSSLFFQAVRIIKEMREATHGVCPAFAVWENVPGAYSSNKGNDFRLVLESLARVSEPEVSIPLPEKGKWQRAGEIIGDGWSVAWRTLDAQYWGVPQRRKRIYLVADFGSERAEDILFKPDSLLGYPAPGAEAWEGIVADAPGSAGGSSGADRLIAFHAQQDPISSEVITPCLGGQGQATVDVVYPINLQVITRHKALGRGTGFGAGEAGDAAYTLQAGHEHGVIYALHDKATRYQGGGNTRDNDGSGNGLGVSEEGVQYTLTGADRHGVVYAVDCRNMCLNEELSSTLQAKENGGQSLNYQNPIVYPTVTGTLCASGAGTQRPAGQANEVELCVVFSRQRSDELVENNVASCQTARQYKDSTDLVVANARPPRKYIVRRLTPTECARLQGFPDTWGDLAPYDGDDAFWAQVRGTQRELAGLPPLPEAALKPGSLRRWYDRLHNDSAEYRMWGNGIALPCAVFVLGRLKTFLEVMQ